MRRAATAYAAGLIFGVGLVVSNMIDPSKIVAFLDFWRGRWPAVNA
jgi:uncharacterized membrane protein YedE/YeeE